MPPKRIILRLRENDFPNMLYPEIVECVKHFLALDGRPVEEADDHDKHYLHFQPPSPEPPQTNPRFHIILDMDVAEHSGPLPVDFPHEIYRVAKVEGQM